MLKLFSDFFFNDLLIKTKQTLPETVQESQTSISEVNTNSTCKSRWSPLNCLIFYFPLSFFLLLSAQTPWTCQCKTVYIWLSPVWDTNSDILSVWFILQYPNWRKFNRLLPADVNCQSPKQKWVPEQLESWNGILLNLQFVSESNFLRLVLSFPPDNFG